MKKQAWPLLGVVASVLMVGSACASPAASTQAVSESSSQTSAEQADPVDADPTESVDAAAIQSEPTQAESAPGLLTFALVPAESEARFIVDEVLSGSPKTVVGTTPDIEGTLVPDFGTPSNTTVGTIRVDLSTLATDNNFRNRAMRDTILQTGNEEFRYAEFTPTSLNGLPETVVMGEAFNFQITGNLTLHGVTREQTFDVTVTPVSETRLEGTASLTILYSDFDINILRLPPQVASVGDEVTLELEFVAVPG